MILEVSPTSDFTVPPMRFKEQQLTDGGVILFQVAGADQLPSSVECSHVVWISAAVRLGHTGRFNFNGRFSGPYIALDNNKHSAHACCINAIKHAEMDIWLRIEMV